MMNDTHYNNHAIDLYDIKMNYVYPSEQYQSEFINETEEADIHISQHLTAEQYQYEFPTRSRLEELSFLDDQEEHSYFDSTSFTAYMNNTPALIPGHTSEISFEDDSTTMISSHQLWHETVAEESSHDQQIVEDSRLSPLQLPAQAELNFFMNHHSPTNSIITITQRPVGPSSFLSKMPIHNYGYNHTPSHYTDYNSLIYKVFEEEDDSCLDIYCNESVPVMDTDFDSTTTCSESVRTSESRIVLIKLNKQKRMLMYVVRRCSNSDSHEMSVEGYDDTDQDEGVELESDCVFCPIYADEDKELFELDQAAIKIQSLWRGYRSRRDNKISSTFSADQRVLISLAQVCGRIQRRQMNKLTDRIYQLEQRVDKETGMRMTFEKTMEDMTVLIDQQQKILYDRIDQEVRMRQTYEHRMNATLQKMQPLENKLKKETAARNKLEEMMSRILEEVRQNELLRQQESAENAETKKQMQSKLDKALEELAKLKKTRTPPTAELRPSLTERSGESKKTEVSSSRRVTVRQNTVPTKDVMGRRPLRAGESTGVKAWDIKKTRQSDPVDRPSVIPSTRSPLARPSVIPSNRRPLLRNTSSLRTVVRKQ